MSRSGRAVGRRIEVEIPSRRPSVYAGRHHHDLGVVIALLFPNLPTSR
jgi:hypothetical protein